MSDAVNQPSHYTDGKYETIDFIEGWKLNYHLGNAVKYISRAGKKDPKKATEDLRKAIWYLKRYEEKCADHCSNWPLASNGAIGIFDYCRDKKLSPHLTSALTAVMAVGIPEAIQEIETAIWEMERSEENEDH